MAESGGDQPGLSTKRARNESPKKPKEELGPTWDPLAPMPQDVIDHLVNVEEWDFDVIKMESLTWQRPLTFLGRSLFGKMNVADALRVDDHKIWKWLARMEELHLKVPYHNSTHSADVLQGSVYFLKRLREKGLFTAMIEATVMVAAVIHDLQHPGRTNASLSAEGHDLALTYNDRSVLENFHLSKAFKETLSNRSINIFDALKVDEYKAVRKDVINLVLATDMAHHADHVQEFTLLIQRPENGSFDAQGIAIIAKMVLKCADTGNPTRKWEFGYVWANRICTEFRNQTEDEIRLNLPVTNPAFVAESEDLIPRLQLDFIEQIVQKTHPIWCGFVGLPHLEEHLEKNYQSWKNMATESGNKTAGEGGAKME